MSEQEVQEIPDEIFGDPKEKHEIDSIEIGFHIQGTKYGLKEGIRLLKMDPDYTVERLKAHLGLKEEDEEALAAFKYFTGGWDPNTDKESFWSRNFIPSDPKKTVQDLTRESIDMPVKEALNIFSDENGFKPFTCAEVIVRYGNDSTKFMQAMDIMGPERMFNEMGGELIDEKTLTKERKNTYLKKEYEAPKFGAHAKHYEFNSDMFEDRIDVYEDTYRLYKIVLDKDKMKEAFDDLKEGENVGNPRTGFGANFTPEEMMEDSYVVHCVCPSTKKDYYLFVEKNNDAFAAIANTFEDHNGRRFSVEDWKTMESET